MNKFPILLSIPHGGRKRPIELDEFLCINDKDLFDDSDPFVIEIYNLKDKVQTVIKTDVARAFVDLNRSPDDLPPKNPDGVIKSSTCYQKPIYVKGKEPDKKMIEKLLQSYYFTYHNQLIQACQDKEVVLALDCHSMASTAPNISPDGEHKKRPKFCISNQEGKSCSNEILKNLADSISKSFSIPKSDISLNEPFKGGHITKTYGNNPIPWIQVEMNRDFYLSEEWFDAKSLKVEQKRLEDLNKMFENTIEDLFTKI